MSSAARQGRLFIVIAFILVAAGEAVVLAISYKRGTLDWGDAVRVVLTLGLFLNTWEGGRWSRWFLVLCFLGATAYGVYVLMTDPRAARPLAVLVLLSMSTLFLVLAAGMASPMVAAFQQHQREKNRADDADTPKA